MNTVLFVNGTIGFSENFFLVIIIIIIIIVIFVVIVIVIVKGETIQQNLLFLAQRFERC